MLEELKKGLGEFESGLEKGVPVFKLQENWAKAIDKVVARLFNGNKTALFALGGYGRREMSPYSDIDLMFLYEDDIGSAQKVVDSILYPLWDSKFEAGGATRTLKDCETMFKCEIRAQTAMLDSRFIAGNKDLADRFFKLADKYLKSRIWRKKFVRGKYFEQEARFRKFGGSVYMLEPHIKESEGGLREYQTASWIDLVLNNPTTPPLVKGGLNEIIPEIEFLFNLRSHLHFIAGKREDRLTFENQKVLALKFNESPEDLMRRYYKATSSIHNKAKLITNEAAPLLKRFFSSWREGRVRKIIGCKPSWQRLVANRDILYQALLILHESGELKKLIPSFEDIYFRTQYGAYHVYTVDVHSIFTVKNILDLEDDKKHELIRLAYRSVGKKDLLLLTALLHDIGKAEQKEGRHAHLGAEIAGKEAARLGYKPEDVERMAFLIESHLVMPRIAFSRDLADPRLIENFANSVETVDMLNMLFILSYADIASIGPDVWNAWKEKLLCELYLASKKFLLGHKTVNVHKEALSSDDIHSKIWFSNMPERYFIANDHKAIKSHIELFKTFSTQLILVKHISSNTHSEFQIITNDAPGIFSKIAGVMTANNVNILDAELNTAKNGIVFDILRVANEIGRPVSEPLALRITLDLEDVFRGKKKIEDMLKKRASIFKKRGAEISPRVVIDNDVSVYYTVIDIFAKDRVGLLYDLSTVLFKENCSIGVAKILTNAEMAKDSFYIKSAGGAKIESKEKLEEIKTAILNVL